MSLARIAVTTALLLAFAAHVQIADAREAAAAEPVTFPVSFETEDGFTLHGDLVSAASTESPVAILLHQYRSDRTSWRPLVDELVSKGITVLALDQRAHGESTQQGERTVRVEGISRHDFGDVVRAGPKDVAAARAFLAGRGFDVSRIALVGASYGCTVALLASDQEGVVGLALLSPGTDYFGVNVVERARRYPGAILAAAAEDDPQAMRSAATLTDGRKARSDLLTFPEGGHGTALLTSQPKFVIELREYLRQVFRMVPQG